MIEFFYLCLILITSFLAGFVIIKFAIKLELSRLSMFTLSTTLGLGLTTLVAFLLGLLGWLSTIAIHLVFFGTIISAGFLIYKKRKPVDFSFKNHILFRGRTNLFLIISLLSLFLFNFIRNLVPVLDNDSLAAYISIPKWYLMLGSVEVIPTTIWDNTPQYAQILSLIGLTLGIDYLPQILTGWLPSVLIACLVFDLARTLNLGTQESLIGVLLFYASPTVFWIVATNKVDLLWLLFDFSAIYIFVKYFLVKQTRDVNVCVLLGVFLGLGFGTKFQSLITFGIISFFIITYFLLYTKEINLQLFKKITIHLGIIFLGFLLFSSPNLIRNTYHFQNPFFPLFSVIEFVGEDTNYARHLIDTSLFGKIAAIFIGRNYFVTPNILFNAQPFGGILLALIPFAFLNRFNMKIHVVFVLFFLLFVMAMLLIKPLYPRHVFPVLPLLAITASAGFMFLIQKLKRLKFIFLVFLFLSFSLHAEIRLYNFFETQLNYLFGKETKEDFLIKNLYSLDGHPDLPIVDYINKKTDIEDKTLLLFYGRTYYLDRITVFGPYMPDKFIYYEKDSEKLLNKLKESNIKYVWYNGSSLTQRPVHRQKMYQESLLFDTIFQLDYLESVVQTESEVLWKILH